MSNYDEEFSSYLNEFVGESRNRFNPSTPEAVAQASATGVENNPHVQYRSKSSNSPLSYSLVNLGSGGNLVKIVRDFLVEKRNQGGIQFSLARRGEAIYYASAHHTTNSPRKACEEKEEKRDATIGKSITPPIGKTITLESSGETLGDGTSGKKSDFKSGQNPDAQNFLVSEERNPLASPALLSPSSSEIESNNRITIQPDHLEGNDIINGDLVNAEPVRSKDEFSSADFPNVTPNPKVTPAKKLTVGPTNVVTDTLEASASFRPTIAFLQQSPGSNDSLSHQIASNIVVGTVNNIEDNSSNIAADPPFDGRKKRTGDDRAVGQSKHFKGIISESTKKIISKSNSQVSENPKKVSDSKKQSEFPLYVESGLAKLPSTLHGFQMPMDVNSDLAIALHFEADLWRALDAYLDGYVEEEVDRNIGGFEKSTDLLQQMETLVLKSSEKRMTKNTRKSTTARQQNSRETSDNSPSQPDRSILEIPSPLKKDRVHRVDEHKEEEAQAEKKSKSNQNTGQYGFKPCRWSEVVLQGRGLVGETCLHLCLLLNTSVHQILIKYLVHRFGQMNCLEIDLNVMESEPSKARKLLSKLCCCISSNDDDDNEVVIPDEILLLSKESDSPLSTNSGNIPVTEGGQSRLSAISGNIADGFTTTIGLLNKIGDGEVSSKSSLRR